MNVLEIRRLPKVVLHEHLDGGLRPSSIIELADEVGYRALPASEPDALAAWFDQRDSGSLVRYLDAFTHTVAVMQTADALARCARESLEDLAADGVVYAEIRFAPSLHLQHGLDRAEVIEAVLAGLREASAATGAEFGVIVDAMRHADDSVQVAHAAGEFVGRGVVGFDLAGPEAGYPPDAHSEALAIAVEAGLRLTIHAGEAAGVESIAAAIDCGAERIGHGIRIIDDCTVHDGAITLAGPVATRVILDDVILEVCPTSNLGTGAVSSMELHPIGMLHRAGFPVTVNTDNRLMSRTSMTEEFGALTEHHGFTREDLRAVTMRGIGAAFCSRTVRDALADRIERAYSAM